LVSQLSESQYQAKTDSHRKNTDLIKEENLSPPPKHSSRKKMLKTQSSAKRNDSLNNFTPKENNYVTSPSIFPTLGANDKSTITASLQILTKFSKYCDLMIESRMLI
jgi:tRNA U34 5-carboxymethylaminomethyl modifying enzyme MnmG/GidA